jgi:hypothetical protein
MASLALRLEFDASACGISVNCTGLAVLSVGVVEVSAANSVRVFGTSQHWQVRLFRRRLCHADSVSIVSCKIISYGVYIPFQ